jgi:hypothetical protein
MQLRDSLAEDCLEMLIQWLKNGGNVGIHGQFYGKAHSKFSHESIELPDATNSTRSRR